MDNIKVNPNINTSIKKINHLYPIEASLSGELVKINYGENTVKDLRELFFKGKDTRLNNVPGSIYEYRNYDENNIDKIPTKASYEEFRKIVDQINDSAEYKRKTNLIDYYDNIVFGDFVLNYYSGAIKEIDISSSNSETKLLPILNNRDQIVKSYIPLTSLRSFYKFLHVKNAPADLCAYMNIRGILFKMNKISDTLTSTDFEFQYPAFLLEPYVDMYNSVLNISFNKTVQELKNMKVYGSAASCSGDIDVSVEGFRGLNYFKKF